MNKNESKYFNTAKKMNDALISLLERKDFEYITIKDICNEANVNRSTFYLHYSNTGDLLEEVINTLNASFGEYFKTKGSTSFIQSKDSLDDLYLITDEYLIPYLNFIKENKKIYKAVKNHPELFNASSTYDKMFQSLFVPILTRFGEDKKWYRYVMDFYINGINSFIFNWILDDCEIPVEEVSNYIQGLVVRHDKKNS